MPVFWGEVSPGCFCIIYNIYIYIKSIGYCVQFFSQILLFDLEGGTFDWSLESLSKIFLLSIDFVDGDNVGPTPANSLFNG